MRTATHDDVCKVNGGVDAEDEDACVGLCVGVLADVAEDGGVGELAQRGDARESGLVDDEDDGDSDGHADAKLNTCRRWGREALRMRMNMCVRVRCVQGFRCEWTEGVCWTALVRFLF